MAENKCGRRAPLEEGRDGLMEGHTTTSILARKRSLPQGIRACQAETRDEDLGPTDSSQSSGSQVQKWGPGAPRFGLFCFEAVLALSGERLQTLAQLVGIPVRNEVLDLVVRALPHGNSSGEQAFSLGRENQNTVAPIRWVPGDFDQAAACQGFQCSGEGGAIHGEKRRHGAHGRWFRPIQRHEQGKLSVGQVKGTQDFIKAPRQRAGRALHMKTETAVPNQKGGFIREFFRA